MGTKSYILAGLDRGLEAYRWSGRLRRCQPPAAGIGVSVFLKTAVLQAVAEIVRGLRNDLAGAEINDRTLLLADLAIESIDLVMLNELVAQHFQYEFPFTDFMAELGRRVQRDVLIGEFVDFLLVSLESASNTLAREK